MKGKRREKLKVPPLGQLGIVVRDLDKTMKYYQDVFGIGPWAVFEGSPEKCTDRGKEISYTGKIAMAQSGPVQIELIQITAGEGIHSEFLRKRGEGLHHIGFFVNNLAERLAAAREESIEVLQQGLLRQLGLTIEYAYFDTTDIGGVIAEYIEPRFMGLPFPMRSPLLRLGAKLGEKVNR